MSYRSNAPLLFLPWVSEEKYLQQAVCAQKGISSTVHTYLAHFLNQFTNAKLSDIDPIKILWNWFIISDVELKIHRNSSDTSWNSCGFRILRHGNMGRYVYATWKLNSIIMYDTSPVNNIEYVCMTRLFLIIYLLSTKICFLC